MKKTIPILFALATGATCASSSHADEFGTQLSHAEADARIESLDVDMSSGQVVIQRPKVGTPRPFVEISGKFLGKDQYLLLEKKMVQTDPEGEFRIFIPIERAKSQLDFRAIDPYGEVKAQQLNVTVTKWELLVSELNDTRAIEKHFSAGLGITSSSYSEISTDTANDVAPFSQIALTGKVGFRTLIWDKKWELGANVYGTLKTLSASKPNQSARYIGFNLRAGKRLGLALKPWSLWIYGGFYFTSASVTIPTTATGKAGFRNMGGPQIFPTISRTLNNQSVIGAYFKFSPVTDGASFLSLGNNELAVGMNWLKLRANRKHRWGITLDYARLSLVNVQGQAVNISSNSVTLGGVYEF